VNLLVNCHFNGWISMKITEKWLFTLLVIVLILVTLIFLKKSTFDFDAGYNTKLSVQQMSEDIGQLKDMIQNEHPLYKSNPEKVDELFSEIEQSITEEKYLSEFSRVLASNIAKMNDAHTWIELVNGNLTLPLIFKHIDNAYYSLDKYKDINAGDRIINIGGIPVSRVYQSYSEQISSENEFWKRETFESYFIDIGRIIELGGKITLQGGIKIKYESDGQIMETTLLNNELITEQNNREIRNKILYGDAQINTINGVRLDFYQSKSYARFVLRNCEYTSYYAMKVDELFKGINENGISNIIIDLRGNLGGTTEVVDYFKARLDAFNSYLSRRNESELFLIVLVDNGTFSGGVHFAGVMKYDYNALLIGQPTGDSLFGYGNVQFGQLTNSTLYYSVSSSKFNGYGKNQTYSDSIYPDIITYYNPMDYVLGNDIDMNIAEFIISIREDLKK